jgi:hypothetical protein
MKQGSGKGCTMLTLKGERCRNPTRWTPDRFLVTQTCRIHQHLEPRESFDLAQEKHRAHLDRVKALRETRRMVAKLPPLSVSVKTIF